MKDRFIREITIDWSTVEPDSYLRTIPALNRLERLSLDYPVTLFAGENGTGKSTLLEGIAAAYGFNPEGGTVNYAFSTKDTHSSLYQAIRLSRSSRRASGGYFLRAESFYNVATKEEEYAKGPGGVEHHYHEKSHGESFIALAQDYFHENGIYLMDEPEAALSPQRQLTLLIQITKLAEQGAQFVIATHSPILLGIPDAHIYSFEADGVSDCMYEDTDSYRITKLFVDNRRRMLEKLLEEE